VADAAVVQLKERDLELLVKFLGLLGSDQVGERAAAALKVHEWAVARGVSWREMLIPDEPEEVPVEVSVGQRTNGRAHFYGQQGPYASPAPPFQQANPFANQAFQQAAQQAYANQQNAYAGGLGGAASGLGGMGGAPGPPPAAPAPWPAGSPAWAPLASEFLAHHANLLRSPKELQFVQDQVQRARSYGKKATLSQAQEDWLRDVLLRAALTW